MIIPEQCESSICGQVSVTIVHRQIASMQPQAQYHKQVCENQLPKWGNFGSLKVVTNCMLCIHRTHPADFLSRVTLLHSDTLTPFIKIRIDYSGATAFHNYSKQASTVYRGWLSGFPYMRRT